MNDSGPNLLDLENQAGSITYVAAKKANGAVFSTDDNWRSQSDLFNLSADFTITGWIWLDSSPPAAQRILGRGTSLAQASFVIDATATLLWFRVGEGSTYESVGVGTGGGPISITTDTWAFFALVVRGTDIELYIETPTSDMTVPRNAGTLSGRVSNTGIDTEIGHLGGAIDFEGRLDELKFWDHALTKTQRIIEQANLSDKYKLEVGNHDFSGVISLNVKQSIADYTRSFTAKMKDGTRSIRDIVSQDDDVNIWMKGTKVFKGKVESKFPSRNRLLAIAGRDYSARFIDAIVSASFAATISSTMITDLMALKFPGEGFTTTGVQVTTIPRDRNIAGWYFINFLRDLSKSEKFVWYIDVFKDLKFQPEEFIDSGKHYSDAGGTSPELRVLHHGFKEKSDRIINSVNVVYGANLDKEVNRKNSASIVKYRKREKKEPNSQLTTLDEAIEYGDFLLRKYANEVTPTPVLIKLDPTLEAGEIVYLTIEAADYNDEPFVLLELEHSMSPPRTDMVVGLATEQTSEVLQELIRKMRNVEEQTTGTVTTIDTVDDTRDDLFITATFKLEKRSSTGVGAVAGRFLAGTKKAGQSNSTAWTSVITDTPAALTTIGLETLAKIISQIAVRDPYDSINTHMATGSGSTPIQPTDTALETEIARADQELGFPNDEATDGHLVFETIISDTILPGTATLREFAILNDITVGELLSRYVHTSNISKAADEDYKITWDLDIARAPVPLVTIAGLNLIRDLIGGISFDYIDSVNGSIEVVGSATYREVTNAGYPKHTTTPKSEVLWQISVANPGEYATGGTITQFDLYNLSSGGVQVLTITVDTITTVINENNIFRILINLLRG